MQDVQHLNICQVKHLTIQNILNCEKIKYILKGEAQIQDEYKNGTNMSFQLNQAQSGTILELPYIYYLGYSITLENEKGKTILEPYESENGFVAIHLNGTEKGRINVTYTGTNIMKGGMVVSILSLSGMVLYMYVCKRTKMNIDKSESNQVKLCQKIKFITKEGVQKSDKSQKT